MTRLLAVTLAIIVALSGTVSAEERYGKQKVVYHINYDGGPD